MRRSEMSGLYEGDPAHDGLELSESFKYVHQEIANRTRSRRASSCTSPKRKAPINFGKKVAGRCHINYDMYVRPHFLTESGADSK